MLRPMAFKLPESVLVVIHTAALDVLLIERAANPGFWQSVTGSREPAAHQPLRDLAAMARPLRARRHAQCRACLRLPRVAYHGRDARPGRAYGTTLAALAAGNGEGLLADQPRCHRAAVASAVTSTVHALCWLHASDDSDSQRPRCVASGTEISGRAGRYVLVGLSPQSSSRCGRSADHRRVAGPDRASASLHPLRDTGPGGSCRTRSPVIVIGVSVPMASRGWHASVELI
jgi:hypothetical protein